MEPNDHIKVRPAHWRVVLAAICAFETVYSYAIGQVNGPYIWWIALFLVIELGWAISRHPGRTLSERFWAWAGIRPRRASRWVRIPSAVPFCYVLATHLATGGSSVYTNGAAVAIAAAPLALVIAWSVRFDKFEEP